MPSLTAFPGKKLPDATLDPLTVRADRGGAADRRVYTIQFTASDGRGGGCAGTVTVWGPHDQGTGVFWGLSR